jgi:pentatricopeptide repeat protein
MANGIGSNSVSAHRLLTAAAAALLLATASACSSPEQRVEKYTASGLSYLEKGDFGRANVQFQNALKINEEHVPALVGLATLFERRQDFRNMFGVLQRVVRLDPQNTEAHIKIGKLYLIGSDETAALESADTALAQQPENPDAIALKSAVLLKLDDTAGAVELARKALSINPATTEAVAVLATERAQAGDQVGALTEVDRAIETAPKSPILHLLRLQLLSNLGRRDELKAGYLKVIELFPTEAAYRQLYASFLIKQGDLAGAREELAKIVDLSSGRVDPVLDVVRIDYRAKGAEAAKQTFAEYAKADPDNIDLQFAFATFLRQEKDFAGAEAIYKAMMAKKSDKPLVLRAKNELAALRLMEGKKDEAVRIVDEILKADAHNTDALLKRAGLKIEAGNYDDAVTDLRAALTDKPDSTQAKLLMATAFERKGDIEFATSQMAQAVAESKNEPMPSNMFAKFLVRHGDVPRAERVVLDSLANNPGNIENLKLLAALQLLQQNWRGAEETAKIIEQVNSQEPTVNRILGAAYAGLGDYSGAIEALSAENSRAPLGARPLSTLVGAYLKEGRAEDAEKMLKDMIAADEKHYAARILLAQVQQSQKKPEEMEATLQEAMRANAERAEAVEMLYRLYRGSGREAQAERLLEERLAASPDNDGFRILKADLLLSRNQREEALAMYEDILKRRPQDLLVSNNYASLLNDLRDDDASRAKARDVAKVLEGSENPYFLDTYGWSLYRTGDFAGAVKALEAAAEGAPDFVEINYHLGAAYLANGETEKAKAQLEKVSAAGQSPFAQRARDLLAQN